MKEFIYEILVRGSQSGFDAAHMIRGKVVADEEGEERVKLGKAEPLDVDAVQSVLGAEPSGLLVQVQELQSRVDTLTRDLADSESIASNYGEQIEKLQAELIAAEEANVKLQTELIVSCNHQSIVG